MFANGLATTVWTWVRWATISSRPSSIAQPPVSRMWSTLLNWVEVKKNCRARWISSTIFSLKGCSTSGPKFSGRLPTRLAASASSGGMSNCRAMSCVSGCRRSAARACRRSGRCARTVTRVTVAPMSTMTVTSLSEMPGAAAADQLEGGLRGVGLDVHHDRLQAGGLGGGDAVLDLLLARGGDQHLDLVLAGGGRARGPGSRGSPRRGRTGCTGWPRPGPGLPCPLRAGCRAGSPSW